MLSKSDLIKYEKPIADAYAEVESVLMENIAKHIASGKAWGTAAWEIEKLAEMGRLNEENARIINRYLSNVPQAVLDALKGASRDSYAYVESQASMAERLHAVTTDPVEMVADNIQAFYDQARESLNMVNTVMLESGMQAYLTATRDGLRWVNTLMATGTEEAAYGAFNTATQGVLTGAITADEAKKRTIKKFADQGLTGFVDRSGRHWSPEAYTSMVIRSTVHNCSVQAVKTYMQAAGSNVFQCSWHPASRPTHYPYQGKFYSWDDVPGIFVDGAGMRHTVRPVSETGYGSAAGLFGVNCGHTAFAMVPGVTMPISIKDMPDEKTNNERYNLLQAQRTMERNIRTLKTRAAIYEAAGDTEAARKEKEKLWVAQRGLSQYVRDNNLTRDPERERVYGQVAGIRGVKPKGWTPAQKPAVTFSNADPKTDLAREANGKGVAYKEVKLWDKIPSIDDIVSRIGGGDRTAGSCSSLAFAYLANRNGCNVVDYRGGTSQMFFSRNMNIYKVPEQIPNAKYWKIENYNDLKGAAEAFTHVEPGKEYYFATGRHAAVVRLSPDTGKLQYLELQSAYSTYLNGWHDFDIYGSTEATLRGRFRAQKSHTSYGLKLKAHTILIDGDTLTGDEYRDLMGYINTDVNNQQKGAGGSVK